jgi:hypothetical protein
MPKPPDLTYPSILELIRPFLVSGRTESHAFLVWFLQHYYRFDETEAQDAVCDGFDDKGIDGVYVDENLEAIDVFQCKLVQSADKTLGDTQLKEFAGTLSQFENAQKITEIAATTSNTELSNLLTTSNVADKVKNGYTVRGIFVINVNRDQNAIDYLPCREDIILFDKSDLEKSYIPVGPSAPIGAPAELDVFGFDCAKYQIEDVEVILAPLKGSELVGLDGIVSSELFAWNVRGSLGRTKVNKEIAKSIANSNEHKNFLLYHNGLTILCKELEKLNDKIRISGYSVVNGCQSLTSLYDNRLKITDDLRILTRLIHLSPEHDLAEKITHHSNNQNPINARDLQANSMIQRRLQNEFSLQYPDQIFYRIKRGESEEAPQTIDNDEAGRLLLAFDLKEPWTCHQSYKLFDELHTDIFARPEVNAHRIVAISDIHSCIVGILDKIEYHLMATYRLTQYFLLYLMREALEYDKAGKDFIANPSAFIQETNGRDRLKVCMNQLIQDIIIDLNAEVRDRNSTNNPLDYKRELKSPSAIRQLTKDIIPQYLKAVSRKRATCFGTEWAESAKTKS